MVLLKKIIIFILAVIIAAAMAKYREKLVRIFGKNYYFEKYLGQGGSYNFWPLFGIFLIILALVYLTR